MTIRNHGKERLKNFSRELTGIRLALVLSALFTIALSASLAAEDNKREEKKSGPPTIAEFTKDMARTDGYFPFHWDKSDGKLWLEISRLETEFLYTHALRTGLGSNDVGLDRGQLGRERIVKFIRFGPKVFLMEPNLDYRATTDNPDERRAVEESFARSVLWSGKIEAESGDTVLVDLSSMLLRDAHNVTGSLERSEQGQFSLDTERSAVDIRRCKAFPGNTELEALLTFTSEKPGPEVRSTTPTAEAISLWQRHSFIELPDDKYTTREFDPRAGAFAISYADYAAPLDKPLMRRLIVRHRLQKKHPSSATSEPIEPIVYYVDRGAPEPVRSALIEGASWWAKAFEAAGFANAFHVKVMPEGADALDVRYNVIQWVHRSTRGWSYGGSVIDPRTGEIIKGHVSLGSLRVRQDRLLFEGLRPWFSAGGAGRAGSATKASEALTSLKYRCDVGASPGPEIFASLDANSDAVELALARIRQLAAHEVGHTLGLAHNFAASTYGRASVMDYPAPLAKIVGDSALDFSDAYAVGAGEWDVWAIRHAYTEYESDIAAASGLSALIDEALERKLLFITDADARSAGAAHPLASLWDNGADPVDALTHEMRVREIALANFGARSIAKGTPLSELEKTLVPLYLHHRFQIQATAKSIGGMYYSYQLRGDKQAPPKTVPAEDQRRALEALLATLDPEALGLDENILAILPPPAFGYGGTRETFPGNTDVVFDPVAIAEIASRMTVQSLLNPQRAARLMQQNSRDNNALSFVELIDGLNEQVWDVKVDNELARAVARGVQRVLVDELIYLAGNASSDVRAVTTAGLKKLSRRLKRGMRGANEITSAHRALMASDIDRFLDRPHKTAADPGKLSAPPGSPIGG